MLKDKALEIHERYKGKIAVNSKISVNTKMDLSLLYSPGVAEPCKKIHKNPSDIYKYTSKGNLVAVVTDGTAVLGLGDIGPEASLPVMEGKSILFKEFADVDAFPICLKTTDVDEIVRTVKLLEPTFGGINLEDISAPRCIEIENRLKNELSIPVFHDDQHGTAVVTLAALINSLKIAEKDKDIRITVCGVGAAGSAIISMLNQYGFKNIIAVDEHGIIDEVSLSRFTGHQKEILSLTNNDNVSGDLSKALEKSDCFIGVSVADIVTKSMIKSMNAKPIVLAMANPDPEIKYEDAIDAGAYIVGTGRSDYPNQVNNVLAFPGIFRGALDARSKITSEMLWAAALAIANYIPESELSCDNIIPDALDKNVATSVASAVYKASKKAM